VSPTAPDHGVRAPEGWTFESLPRLPDYVLLTTPPPMRHMATIDFRARGFRSGYSISSRFVGEEWDKPRKKYRGRSWKQALVNDAAAHLRELWETEQ
jgi:hypothetical protein